MLALKILFFFGVRNCKMLKKKKLDYISTSEKE